MVSRLEEWAEDARKFGFYQRVSELTAGFAKGAFDLPQQPEGQV